MKKYLILLITVAILISLCACGETKTNEPQTTPADNSTASTPASGNEDNTAPVGQTEKSDDDATATGTDESTNMGTPTYGDYYMTVNGYSFGIMDPMDDVLAALGEPSGGTNETASCAYQGSDYFYYFDSLSVEIMANNVDGILRVTDIKIIDDMIKNPQGVTIGTKISDATAAMGENFNVNGSVYSYVMGSTTVLIQCGSDNCVKALEYTVSNSN